MLGQILLIGEETALVGGGHGRVEGGRAGIAAFLATGALGIEMVVSRHARDDFTALGHAEAFRE